MFTDENAPPPDPIQLAVEEMTRQVDEVKRYAAATYERVDNEIAQIIDGLKRIEDKLNETDRQVDRIEGFERAINDIKASVQRLERKS